MKAVLVLCAVALIGSAMGATRFQDQRCYESFPKNACSTAELRRTCVMTRWACREQGVAVEAKDDTEFKEITGDCDTQGPRVFCKDADSAKKCNADKKLCNDMGFWHFE